MNERAAIDKEFRRGRTRAGWWAFAVWIVGSTVCEALGVPSALALVIGTVGAVIVFLVKLHGSFNAENVLRDSGVNNPPALPGTQQSDNAIVGKELTPASFPQKVPITESPASHTLSLPEWSVKNLAGKTTFSTYRNSKTLEWLPLRAALHQQVIAKLLAHKPASVNPAVWIVMGGVGAGKSTVIGSKLAPQHPNAVIIDADNLWLEIPEYNVLQEIDWNAAANQTYQEVRYLNSRLLAEAVAQGVDIILEEPGSTRDFNDLVAALKDCGYKVFIDCVECPIDIAKARIEQRAHQNPTPADNVWTSSVSPEFADKYDYQSVNTETFAHEYERARRRSVGESARSRLDESG